MPSGPPPSERSGSHRSWWDPDAVPAATVIVLRDDPADGHLQVLMLRRDDDLGFAGGAWVFPGGRIDEQDRDDADEPDDPEPAARRAAVREAAEEAGLSLPADELVRWSHWTPPSRAGRRFTTAFFCTRSPARADVRVDDGEIREHRWARPIDVIAERDAGTLRLTPPTFITLVQLAEHAGVDAAMDHAGRHAPEHFSTRIAVDGDEWIALYHGDVAYEAAADEPPEPELLRADGPRHRLRMGSTWTYERRTEDPE